MSALDNSQTTVPRRAPVPTCSGTARARLRLQTIVRLRWLAVLGQSITVIGVYWMLGHRSADRRLSCRDLAVGMAQRRARASATRRASVFRATTPSDARLRHPPARGAALSDRRPGEPVRLPAHRAGHGVGLDAAAADHRGARRRLPSWLRRCSPSSIIRFPGSITPPSCFRFPT